MNNAPMIQSGAAPVAAPSIYDLKPVELESIEKSLKAVQNLKQRVMQEGTHYGTLPGTDKPSLYKPGAEILLQLFRLTSRTRLAFNDLEKSHREYSAEVDICAPDGSVVATGIGVCSTMESKYRYRNDYNVTEVDVPRDYWDRRNAKAKNSELQAILAHALGQEVPAGSKLATKKDANGAWKIAVSFKGEHPDIADVYNTCAKMAKKRALMDGTITATASSSLFTQDVEDFADWKNDAIDVTPGKPNRKPQQQEPPTEEQQKKTVAKQLHLVLANAQKEGLISDPLSWVMVEMQSDEPISGYSELPLETLQELLKTATKCEENNGFGFDDVPDFGDSKQPELLPAVEKQPSALQQGV